MYSTVATKYVYQFIAVQLNNKQLKKKHPLVTIFLFCFKSCNHKHKTLIMTDIDQLLNIIWQDSPQQVQPIDKEELNKIYEMLTRENVITINNTKNIDFKCLEHSLTNNNSCNSTKINYCLRKLNLKERKKNSQHTSSDVEDTRKNIKNNYKKFTKMNVFEEFKPTILTNEEEPSPRMVETFQLIDLSQDSRKLAANNKIEK